VLIFVCKQEIAGSAKVKQQVLNRTPQSASTLQSDKRKSNSMDKRVDKMKKARQSLLDQIIELSSEQLNQIPIGFNNNIIWNITHLIAAQQGICYLRAGQQTIVVDKFIKPFFTNSKPERIIDASEIQEIKKLFISTMDQLQSDYDKSIFGNYTPSPNILKVYGIELKDIDDALEFLLYHEGYHSGCILALKKLVS